MTTVIKTPTVTKGGSYEVTKGKVKQTRKPNEAKTTAKEKK